MDLNYLSNQNTHERDSHITFEEGPHIYTIDGDSDYMSVTTWNHSHFETFNADRIIDNMMKSRNWTNSAYFGMTKQEIKDQWNNNRDEAATAGTKMHYDIECYYNNNVVENDSIEYTYFNTFKADYPDLKPYRTEWMIYDKELKLAGSIDMLFINKEGDLEIYDWKRCKEIKKKSYGKKAKTSCISHLPDSNFWHYSLQLNTYKALLEKNYGKKITKMCLVCMHPNNPNKSYLRYEVPDLSNEIKSLFEYRKRQLLGGNENEITELRSEKETLLTRLDKYYKYIENIQSKIQKIDAKLVYFGDSDTLKEDIEIEVSAYLYEEIEYLVDENTMFIYNNDGSYVGKWIDNRPILD